MKKEKIRELKELINKAYDMSNDSRISLYIRVMEILDYQDENTTIERKMQIKKEYGIGDDKQCQNQQRICTQQQKAKENLIVML